jgi:hypothetical protein
MLDYTVNNTLRGERSELKEKHLWKKVFGMPGDLPPHNNIVRSTMRGLRNTLKTSYEEWLTVSNAVMRRCSHGRLTTPERPYLVRMENSFVNTLALEGVKPPSTL